MPTLISANTTAQLPCHNTTAQPPCHNVTTDNCVELDKENRSGAPDSKDSVEFVDQLNPDGTFDICWVLGNQGEKMSDIGGFFLR